MRRVWRVPWTTHCRLLPHLSECIDIELRLSKRCVSFLDKAKVVRMITNMGFSGLYSIMGGNMRHMNARYGMNVKNVNRIWNEMCISDSDSVRICGQIRELCVWRDKCHPTFLNRIESRNIINFFMYLLTFVAYLLLLFFNTAISV